MAGSKVVGAKLYLTLQAKRLKEPRHHHDRSQPPPAIAADTAGTADHQHHDCQELSRPPDPMAELLGLPLLPSTEQNSKSAFAEQTGSVGLAEWLGGSALPRLLRCYCARHLQLLDRQGRLRELKAALDGRVRAQLTARSSSSSNCQLLKQMLAELKKLLAERDSVLAELEAVEVRMTLDQQLGTSAVCCLGVAAVSDQSFHSVAAAAWSARALVGWCAGVLIGCRRLWAADTRA